MPNPAAIGDLQDRWRALSEQETTNAQALLTDAWALLLTRRPNLEADMAAGTVADANVVRVVCAMVLRVLRNPDGYTSETIDDYTYRRGDLTGSGLLSVTSDELADLTPGRVRNRSIRLVAYGDV